MAGRSFTSSFEVAVKRREKKSRGRAVVVWFGACFVLYQLIGGLLLDYYWPQIRFPYAFKQFRRYQEFARSPDVICLGSSRIESCLLDKEINQTMRRLTGAADFLAFNACVPGGDLIATEFVWHKLWQQGARPKLVVLEVIPEQVNHLNDWLKLHVMRQIRWEDVADYAHEVCRTGHAMRLLQARLIPLYMHRYQLVKTSREAVTDLFEPDPFEGKVNKEAVAGDYRDWSRLAEKKSALQPAQRQETMSGLHGVERGLRRYRPGGTSVLALERFLKFCQQENIPVILLGVPLTEPHRQLYMPEIEGPFRACMKLLEALYPCRYVDCRDQVPDWLFRDNHHANQRGGQYFSQRFAREVLLPAFSKPIP